MGEYKVNSNTSADGSLTANELQELVMETYSRYAILMFEMLRAFEINKYAGFGDEYTKAHNSFWRIIGNKEHAKQVLAFHVAKEKEHFVFPSARFELCIDKALEPLRGYTSAPLMAELSITDAFTLWRMAGSWNGALTLAGIDPLTESERKAAVKRYIIDRASPEILPKTILKRYTPQGIAELQNICAAAKRSGNYPQNRDAVRLKEFVTDEYGEKTVRATFSKLGFPSPSFTNTKVEKFKARSEWWRKSKKYLALQNTSTKKRKAAVE